MSELPTAIGSYVRVPSYDLERIRELNRQGFWIECGTPQEYDMRRDRRDGDALRD